MIFCSKIHYIYRKDACAGVAWPEYRQQSFPNQSLGLLWEKVIFANFPHCCHMLVGFHIYLSQVSLLLQLHGQATTNSR